MIAFATEDEDYNYWIKTFIEFKVNYEKNAFKTFILKTFILKTIQLWNIGVYICMYFSAMALYIWHITCI